MLVLCSECSNHYDDSTQKSTCHGIGSMHPFVNTSPVEEHCAYTRAAWARHVPRKRIDGTARPPEAAERPVAAAVAVAGPSDSPSPQPAPKRR